MKKKGFTLIELLAVIVILAIIALIATPIILNIIEKARKEAFIDTAYGIINAAELQYTEGILDNHVEEKFYSFPQGEEDKLNFSGAEPKGGDVKISNTGKVSIAIHNGDWCVKKMEDDTEVTVEEYNGNCTLDTTVYTPDDCFGFDKSTGTITSYDNSCPEHVVIPRRIDGVTVKEIGEYAFYGSVFGYKDSNDSDIALLQQDDNTFSVKRLNNEIKNKDSEYVYSSYVQITSVIIPDTVIKIGTSAFEQSGLSSLTLGNKVEYIGGSAFYNNDLTSVIIPDSVRTIGGSAFAQNNITDVEIPKNVENISIYSFDSKAIGRYKDGDFITVNDIIIDYLGTSTDVVISNNIKKISNSAFRDKGLTSVAIPDSVESIGPYAFSDNPLTNVDIPSSVTTIYMSSFPQTVMDNYYDQNGFLIINVNLLDYTGTSKDVIIPSSVTSIGARVFRNNQLTSITIPESVTSIGDSSFESNQLTSVVIPESVTSIGAAAFYGNQLTSVTIPSSVTSIGSSAFYWNELTSVTIGNSVRTIGDYAFSYNKLTSVEIPDSVISIGADAFMSNQLTSVTIPESVTSIAYGAFRSNQLTSVTIPNSVTYIGASAFSSNQLTSVTIKGKSSSADFTNYYPNSTPFGWAEGYSDSNIIWNG